MEGYTFTGDATSAKLAAERVPGVRAVGFQRIKGREYLVISADERGRRVSREVPIYGARIVQHGQVAHALRALVGRDAAARYQP